MVLTSHSHLSTRPDIAVFIHSLGGGGAERVAVTLCNAFVENNKRTHVIVIDKECDYHYWDMLSPQVEVLHIQRNKMWQALFPLTRYLFLCRPVRLLCFLSAANIVGTAANVLALRPSRVFISERGVFSYFYSQQKGVKRFFYKYIPLIYHCAEKLICVSQGVAADLQQFVSLPKRKVVVIHNPSLREELFSLKDEPVEHPWFAPGQPPVLLAVGGFRSEKNYPLILRAFAATVKHHNARLLILGEGPDRPALEQQVRDLNITDRVDMPGFKKNPYAYMARAAGFIICSDTEGLPNALIEALGCGCPTIATDCPGGVREILEDGKYGVLVPTGNQEKLAEAMNQLLAHPDKAHAMVHAFQKEKLPGFTPEVIIPQYFAALGL